MSACSLQFESLATAVPLPSWYALATLSRHERVVALELENRGIDAFLPTVTEIHRWSDRRKKVEVPLFPGYIFVQTAMTSVVRRAAICARGVMGFVTMNGEPLPVPEEEIIGIRQLLASEIPCAPYPFLKVGQRVRVRGGALDGIEGCLVRAEGDHKLVVSIDAISRSVALHIDGYDLEAL
jgi:transcription termination/antitermination protein NusG